MTDPIMFPTLVKTFWQTIDAIFKGPVRIPGRNSKEFKRYIKQTHEEITKIHVDYSMIFISAQSRIQELSYRNKQEANPKTVKEIIKQVVEELYEKRKGFEGARDGFRSNLSTRLAMVDNKIYQRFFLTVFDYFIINDDEGFYEKDSSLDIDINRILQQGGLAGRRTPSKEAISNVAKCNSYKTAHKELQKIIDSINMKKFNIDARYRDADDLTAIT